MRGDSERLHSVKHRTDRAHILLQGAEYQWCVPQNVDVFRVGEKERGAINAPVIHDDTRARAEPVDKFWLLATEPISLPMCVARATCGQSNQHTKK